MTSLWAVLPGGIDDPATPSGGNRYDRKVLDLLAGDWEVREIAIPGDWPLPGDAARTALARALAELPDKADVLLDGLVACGVPDLLAPHRDRLRLAILVHLPLSDETGLDEPTAVLLRAREAAALRLAGTVIATSDAAAARLTELHGRTAIAVATPGVDPAPPAVPDPSGRRLLCVASVTARKGQDLLVGVLENRLADLTWSCTFVGALVRPVLHVNSNIRFVGPLHGAALDEAYANADLLVLPSRAETYGMVVTESLARAVPVLATAVGGVPEALGRAPDGTRPGRLIPPDDPDALAAGLRSWLTEPELRDCWRAAAEGRRTTLPTWSATVRRLSEVLAL